jgi:glycine/D-amino acid oxidase-like deaminating enzyme
MRQTVDVAVLGGGIAGCATAYYLSREGIDVAVFERNGVGNAASGYALGLLNPLAGSGIPGPLSAFAGASFAEHQRLWPILEEESDIDFHGTMMPHLQLALNEDETPSMKLEMARWNDADGFSAQWLNSEDIRALEPRVSEDITGAVLLEEVGMVDSQLLTRALMDAARRKGARLIEDEVVGVKVSDSQVTSVKTVGGDIECGAVVVALGPWSGAVGEWLGLDIPVTPFKGQIVRLEGLSPPLQYHVAHSGAVVQKADGMVWVASTEEDAGFDLSTTLEARETLLEQVAKFFPSITDSGVVMQTACIRPRTADGLPILGKAPEWDHVYIATGAEKKGILLGPAMGKAVADLFVRGATGLPIDGFEPNRFPV